jgi:hypothetical protein
MVVSGEQDGVARLEPREYVSLVLRPFPQLGNVKHRCGVVPEGPELVGRRLDVLVEQDIERLYLIPVA